MSLSGDASGDGDAGERADASSANKDAMTGDDASTHEVSADAADSQEVSADAADSQEVSADAADSHEVSADAADSHQVVADESSSHEVLADEGSLSLDPAASDGSDPPAVADALASGGGMEGSPADCMPTLPMWPPNPDVPKSSLKRWSTKHQDCSLGFIYLNFITKFFQELGCMQKKYICARCRTGLKSPTLMRLLPSLHAMCAQHGLNKRLVLLVIH